MALITRLSRWFRADLNAVLDRLEEPDLVLREAIREMQDTLAASRQAQQALQTESTQLAERAARLNTAAAAIGEQLDLCFAADNEALTRQLLRRRLEQQRLAETCQKRADNLARQASELGGEIQRMQQQLEDQRHKAEAFGVPANPGEVAVEDARVSDADVELALLAERRARSVS